MKKFLFILFLFITTNCFAAGIIQLGGGEADLGGYGFTPVTQTDTNASDVNVNSTETDTVVWTPASGKKITLLGVNFTSEVATTLLIETGSTAVVPSIECTASGQIVIGNGNPIWRGSTNSTLTYTVGNAGRHSILMYGYETN